VQERPARPGSGQTALVTGASSGIGYELANLLARDGHDVVLVARSRERLKAVARALQASCGVAAYTIACDLAESGAATRIVRSLRAEGVRVDVLVNNAGFGTWGEFAATAPEPMNGMVRVNAGAVVALTRLLLPGMLARRRGRILIVASLAGFQPGPLMAVYYATKAFLISFGEALAEELRGTGVTVTLLCPGPVRTRFGRRAGLRASRLFSGRALPVMEAAPVARLGYRAMLAGRLFCVPGALSKTLMLASKFSPRIVTRRVTRWLQDRRRR
jgi:hypothetical protein